MRKQAMEFQLPQAPRARAALEREPAERLNRTMLADEPAFAREIYLERRRAERNLTSLLLILLDVGAVADRAARTAALRVLIRRLPEVLRDTDKLGWYRRERTLGILVYDLRSVNQSLVRTLADNALHVLQNSLGATLAGRVQVTIHVFPDLLAVSGESPDLTLYPELRAQEERLLFQAVFKRGLDVLLSAVAFLLLSPLLALLALIIKCTSRGPALFRQQRLGRYGEPFILLKFRTMHANSNPGVHEEYVRQFIAGDAPSAAGIYKITQDSRVTRVGHILRRTSLDELPQLWNVLRGDMSLVGPRPPLAYEYEQYAGWHRRRVLETKPGLTGLWQVQGRSRTSFDDMVRLDLRYARQWSLWLDLKILWHTPGAVLSGRGAC